MKRILLIAGLACAAAMSAVPASAAPMTFSTISNLRYEVTDLTPDDDTEASFSFSGDIFNAASLYYQYWLGPTIQEQHANGFSPQAVGLDIAEGKAAAFGIGYDLSSEASAQGNYFSVWSNFLHTFHLGANTKVTFSADWSGKQSHASPLGSSSSGHLGVNTGGPTVFAHFNTFVDDVLHQGVLSLSAEAGATAVDGYLWAMADSTAYDPTLAPAADVPEPGSVALLLAGLAGLAALRKKSRGQCRHLDKRAHSLI